MREKLARLLRIHLEFIWTAMTVKTEQKIDEWRNPRSNVSSVEALLKCSVGSWNTAAYQQICWQLQGNKHIACLWWFSVCSKISPHFPKLKLVMKSSRGNWRGGTCMTVMPLCIQDEEMCICVCFFLYPHVSQGLSKHNGSIFPWRIAQNVCRTCVVVRYAYEYARVGRRECLCTHQSSRPKLCQVHIKIFVM